MNPYAILAGIALAVSLFGGGMYVGGEVKQVAWDQERAARTDTALVRLQVVTKEVPKIITKVVTKEVTVEKEVERVVTQIPDQLAPDCVLPDRYGMLLAAAANGIDPSSPGVDAFAGTYGCREVLAATLTDLSAGWQNTARLEGLQEYVNTIAQTKGDSP